MKPVFFTLLAFICISQAFGQGCVAVRPMSCSSTPEVNSASNLQEGQWLVSSSYRYFESFRHFRGDEEETHRVEDGTQVINLAHSLDLGITYMAGNRWSLNLNIPIIYYDRSSLYEHYGNRESQNPDQVRFHTGSSGIGDIRFGGNYWLKDPKGHGQWNINVGLGVKMPTGDDAVEDDFHRRSETGEDYTFRRPVDQSIQLGDGGWGVNTEFQGYANLSKRASLYFTGFYLFNPKGTNDTLTRGTAEGVNPLVVNHSVADQYGARIGINGLLNKKLDLFGSFGARLEGVPSKDAIGNSDGYRRPGYIVSVEPALTLPLGNVSMTLSVPIAVYRNRVKSTYDLSDPSGERHGDAAFADYLINFTFSYRFSGKP